MTHFVSDLCEAWWHSLLTFKWRRNLYCHWKLKRADHLFYFLRSSVYELQAWTGQKDGQTRAVRNMRPFTGGVAQQSTADVRRFRWKQVTLSSWREAAAPWMNYQILRILVAVFTVNIILKAPVARSRLVLKSHLGHGSELFDEPRNLSKAASTCATSTVPLTAGLAISQQRIMWQ